MPGIEVGETLLDLGVSLGGGLAAGQLGLHPRGRLEWRKTTRCRPAAHSSRLGFRLERLAHARTNGVLARMRWSIESGSA